MKHSSIYFPHCTHLSSIMSMVRPSSFTIESAAFSGQYLPDLIIVQQHVQQWQSVRSFPQSFTPQMILSILTRPVCGIRPFSSVLWKCSIASSTETCLVILGSISFVPSPRSVHLYSIGWFLQPQASRHVQRLIMTLCEDCLIKTSTTFSGRKEDSAPFTYLCMGI